MSVVRNAALTVAALACGCGGGSLTGADGELAVEAHTSGPGADAVGRSVSWDFLTTYGGTRAQGALVVRNLGRGSLTLESFALDDAEGVFEVDFSPAQVTPGGSASVPIFFNAPEALERRALEAVATLKASGARDGADTAEVLLRGVTVPSPCAVADLDFGIVEVGTAHDLPLLFFNPLPTAQVASVGALRSEFADHHAFGFATSGLPGQVEIPTDGAVEVRIAFRPTAVGDYEATFDAKAAPECPAREVTVRGRGREEVLVWAPELSFGYVPIGLRKAGSVTVQNLGARDVVLSDIRLPVEDVHFKWVDGMASELVVPARGTAEMWAACAPMELGPVDGRLTFNTSVARQPAGEVALRCYGGGPDIEVMPFPTLNFGKVGLVKDASPPLHQTRRLAVLNLGTHLPDAGPEANLHFRAPAFELTPANASTAAGEFEVTLAPGFDNEEGLPSTAGKNAVFLTVKLTPASAGEKQATLKVFTDDVDEPEVSVDVRALVVEVPPCRYTLYPSALEFGVLEPPASRTETFQLRNTGQSADEICLVSALQLSPGSDAAFTLPGGELASKELGPGESLEVSVQAAPAVGGPTRLLKGNVELQLNAPATPLVSVPLSGAAFEKCLVLVPDPVSFGTVKLGCNSPTRTLAFHDACQKSLLVKGFSLVQPGADFQFTPPNGGAQATLEAGSAPLTAPAKFTPTSVGSHRATLQVQVKQNGTELSYVFDFLGEADAAGQNTDSFVQSQRHPVDILFSVNGDMYAWVMPQIETNIAVFFDYLQKAQLPYQVALVECYSGGSSQGEFLYGATHPEKILDPSVQNLVYKAVEKFKSVTNYGSDCFFALNTALTPPLSQSQNAGFLRTGAKLALVAITNAEGSACPPSFPQCVPGGWPGTPFYIAELPKLKGAANKHLVTYNAIAPVAQNPTCPVTTGWWTDNMHALTAITGGLSADLCAYDWSESLRDLAERTTGFRTSFPLSLPPDTAQAAVTVSVNGASVSAVTSTGEKVWTYEPLPNRVRFEITHAPDPGDTIDVTYVAQCL